MTYDYRICKLQIKKNTLLAWIKKIIGNVIKECEICQIYNRKPKGQPEYVSTTRPLEKVTLD